MDMKYQDKVAFDGYKTDVICAFCGNKIHSDVLYTEDAEPSHEKCLQQFEQHWKDRDEMFDLIGH